MQTTAAGVVGQPGSYTISRKSNRGDHRFEPLAIGNNMNNHNPLKLHSSGQKEIVQSFANINNSRETTNSMDL